ncbi:hypothetical protein [Actinokineospora sp. UTMC 2448]|uniref:hypothetical protein n=1 Tax=Actinokineospora sp. UTMC 2448 TaxID=2268449 RepID=UPI0021642472|nr:hypothetical protein [Actinokineospora sp. UTMC 2448]UVS79475.1 hypothetical protein Actkin_03223 [Actinokineospora sp. UTMC 2448]
MRGKIGKVLGSAMGVVALSGTLAVLAPVSEAATTKIAYGTEGSTRLTGLGADLPLGPGQTDIDIDLQSGGFTGVITLPETRTDFNLFGFLSTHAKVKVTQAGPLSGTFRNNAVTASGQFDVQITEVGHFNIGIPLPNCKTTASVRIDLTSSGTFNPSTGGTVTGKYQLPPFADCMFDTEIINALVVGKENTIQITLSAKK